MPQRLFIVVATLRTGSTLFHRAIHQHPQAACLGEVLSPKEETRARVHHLHFGDADYLASPSGKYLDAVDYLDRKLWPNAGDQEAYGVKLLYSMLDWWKLWEYFEVPRGLKIVHLMRNPVASFISWKQARQTDVWHHWTLKEKRLPAEGRDPLYIDPEELFKHIAYLGAAVHRARGLPGEHLEISYADLVRQFQPTMDRVFEFLGVEPFAPEHELIKMHDWDIGKRIKNWPEIAERLAGEHSSLLSEDLL